MGAAIDVVIDFIEYPILFFQSLFLGPAPLPTISPVTDKELKAKTVNSETRLKADAEVGVIHFILVHVGVKQAQMTGDGEEQVVIPWRQPRQLVLKEVRDFFRSSTLSSNSELSRFREYFSR